MVRKSIGFLALAAFLAMGIHAFATGDSKTQPAKQPPPPATAKPAPAATKPAATPAATPAPAPAGGKKVESSNRHLVTFRGEIVDWYCYIEKGLTGPSHRDCGVRCVAGDVCMGLLTNQGDLYMISVNHLRAMDPASFRGVPDPFTTCRGWIAESVDLTGYAMERKGQRIIEIMGVKKATGPPPPVSH